MHGIVTDVNILLGDEISQTSSKTQWALLEAMEEKQVMVDGKTHALKNPFIVIATQNNVGSVGTQLLPYAQIDCFLVRLSIGYPDLESQIEIINDRPKTNPIDHVHAVLSSEDVVKMRDEVNDIVMKCEIVAYVSKLVMASREHPLTEIGISPRGTIAVCRMAKAKAYMSDRDYVIPEDVRDVFKDVCAHRIIINQKGRMQKVSSEQILQDGLKEVRV